ncbi:MULTISPECIES: hypothetical protein [unclassified Lysobacter]|uniref:hypothetical protein n=1 Tax=unclassified Lysobacter TaxID=2635362 RepID=UPI001BED3A14|nr:MULTISPECIES: hypothetical protein [unclassified Lysobacter]MBT2748281.1 hypothetical protein [Lysobacter sp. ISL-42]MBT2749952.1 hypothetical protein [Lysobacter sp. ISL-50]MBT2781280.1 hypothetical protein [Lysobacter sp. ISL-52]
MKATYASSIFINCPFDADYLPMFHAAVFAIFDCGYQPRCALEAADGGDIRIDKIRRIIEACKFGIHDISRTELGDMNALPRFNMPFELGMFLGARYFGSGNQRKKITLILDRERFRYQQFLSDIAGQDIQSHAGTPDGLIAQVRNWLSNATDRTTIPSAAHIQGRYGEFKVALPELCQRLRLDEGELLFNEYAAIAAKWLQEKSFGLPAPRA